MEVSNVVLVVMDTARYREVTAPNTASAMPTVQGLADRGVQFRMASASAPWTLPSHASLFTGQHPTVHGAHALNKSFEFQPTLAGVLGEAGYTTLGFSNNTWVSAEFGFDRGFDEFVTSWQLFQEGVDFGDIAHKYHTTSDRLRHLVAKFSGNPVKNLANILYGKYFRKRNDKGAKRTNRLVRDRLDDLHSQAEPFFIFINYLEPHLPYDPPAKFANQWLPSDVTHEEAMAVNQDAWAYITGQVEMTDREFDILRGLYRGELSYLDARIDDLLMTLDGFGMNEDTVVIITSDHGENIGEHGLMDHQYSLFETLLHVPLVISGPGFDDGSVVEEPVQLTDLYPTILDIAQIESGVGEPRGYSLKNYHDLSEDRPIYAEYLGPQPSIETLRERYEIEKDVSMYDRRLRSIREDDCKLIVGSDGEAWLFDLESDPDEVTNLIGHDPTRGDELSETLDNWVSSLPPIERGESDIDQRTRDRLEDLGYLQ